MAKKKALRSAGSAAKRGTKRKPVAKGGAGRKATDSAKAKSRTTKASPKKKSKMMPMVRGVRPDARGGSSRASRSPEWNSYLRFVENRPVRIERPTSLESLNAAVAKAWDENRGIRAVGSGHSFSDILDAREVLVDLERIDFMHVPDDQERRSRFRRGVNESLVEVGAGITIESLHNRLWDKGLGLLNMGTFNGQKFWGAVSTSTHGSGIGLGPFPDMVRSVVLVGTGANGPRTYRVEPANGITQSVGYSEPGVDELIQNDEEFYSVIASMGCMGIVHSAIIVVRDAYFLTEEIDVTTWSEFKRMHLRPMRDVLQTLPAAVREIYSRSPGFGPSKTLMQLKLESNRHFELIVAPHRDEHPGSNRNFKNEVAVLTIERNENRTATKKEGVKRCFYADGEHALEKQDAKYKKVYDRHYLDGKGVPEKLAPEHFPALFKFLAGSKNKKPYTDQYFKVFRQGGHLQGGYAIEVNAPLDRFEPVMDRIIELCESNRKADERGENRSTHTGPVGVRFVAASGAYLSQHYGRTNVTFEVTMLRGTPHGKESLEHVERELLKLGDVRFHWGLQMNQQRQADLVSRFPKFREWRVVYERFNRHGLFNNAFTDRVGISMPRRR